MNKLQSMALAVGVCAAASFANIDLKAYVKVTDAQLTTPGTKLTLTPDKHWYLDGLVVVNEGCTLVVEPGTWVYGPWSVESGKTGILVVAPGGVLIAEGTREAPIVFTAVGDDPKDHADMGPGAKGLWGGILLLGRAPRSSAGTGYPEGVPPSDTRFNYGGSNENDFSGRLRYVSIRHGGTAVASASETNGLSLYSVGRATVLEYIEVFGNSDDGFEWFGGTVNSKYLVSVYNSDDQFDLDEGFRGKNQFWFSMHQEYEGDRAGEFDGKYADDETLFSKPTLYNFTFIGSGNARTNFTGANQGIEFRDSVGGYYYNGIITQWPGVALRRGRQSVTDPGGYGKFARNWGDSLVMQGTMFWGCSLNTWQTMIAPSSDVGYFQDAANKNRIADPGLRGIGRYPVGHPRLDPRPRMGSQALNTSFVVNPPNDGFYSPVNYAGAFAPNNLWIDGWTALSQLGIATKLVTIAPATCTELTQNEPVFLKFLVKQPGATINTASPLLAVTMNGVNVLPTFLAQQKNFPLAAGGICHYIQFSNAGNMIPVGQPKVGVHTLKCTFPLSTGQVVDAEWNFSIIQ